MPTSSLSQSLRALDGVRVWMDAPLSPFTTIGTGGKADLLVTVSTESGLVEALRLLEANGVAWACLGAGSNLLVADGGFRGAIIKLDDPFHYVEDLPEKPVCDGPAIITVGAGTSLSRLAALAAEVGLAGLEFACGIPGSIGGGIVMNAGAYGSALGDLVTDLEIATASGLRWYAGSECEWGYRHCRLPVGGVVTAVRLRLAPGDPQLLIEEQRAILRRRRVVQPQGVRTFGSAFKNPLGGGAGRLIEAAGLKGERRGDAEVSTVHANFLVNLGEATTADVLALLNVMREEVERTSGVQLEPEVRLLGAGFPWDSSSADPQGPPASHG